MTLYMDRSEILAALNEAQGSMKAFEFASALGCSPAYLSQVYSGKKLPSPRLLSKIGYERIHAYRKTEDVTPSQSK